MAKTKEAILKNPADLKNCPVDNEVILVFDSGEDYTGIFKGIDESGEIILKSLESPQQIGLPFNRLDSYWQRIK